MTNMTQTQRVAYETLSNIGSGKAADVANGFDTETKPAVAAKALNTLVERGAVKVNDDGVYTIKLHAERYDTMMIAFEAAKAEGLSNAKAMQAASAEAMDYGYGRQEYLSAFEVFGLNRKTAAKQWHAVKNATIAEAEAEAEAEDHPLAAAYDA